MSDSNKKQISYHLYIRTAVIFYMLLVFVVSMRGADVTVMYLLQRAGSVLQWGQCCSAVLTVRR